MDESPNVQDDEVRKDDIIDDDAASELTEQTDKVNYYKTPEFEAAAKNIDRYANIFRKEGSLITNERDDSPPLI